MKDLKILLRTAACQIELWSKDPKISCDRSDAMERLAGKLRAAEGSLMAGAAMWTGEY